MEDMLLFDDSECGVEQIIANVKLIEFKTTNEADNLFIQRCTKKALLKSLQKDTSDEAAIVFGLNEEKEIGFFADTEHSTKQDLVSDYLLNHGDSCIVCTYDVLFIPNSYAEDILFFLKHDKLKIFIAVDTSGASLYLEKLKIYKKQKAVDFYYHSIMKERRAHSFKDKQKAVTSFYDSCYKFGVNTDINPGIERQIVIELEEE